MDRIHALLHRDGDDARDVEVSTERALVLVQLIGLISLEAMRAEAVFIRVDGNSLDAHLIRSTHHADSDLTAVRYEELLDRTNGGNCLGRHRAAMMHREPCLRKARSDNFHLVYLSVDRQSWHMAKKKAITREELLDAARGYLRRCGFHGFTMREVAAEVGFSSASLHHHFPTKDDLCAAVLHRHRERCNRRLSLIEAETEDWSRRLQACEDTFADPTMSAGLLVMLMATRTSLPPITANEVELLQSNLVGWLARMTAQAARRGELPETNKVEELPLRLLAQWEGLSVLA
jgi:TetR/AcrR family transcriptional regulator, transcriptional repressor for nem operon